MRGKFVYPSICPSSVDKSGGYFQYFFPGGLFPPARESRGQGGKAEPRLSGGKADWVQEGRPGEDVGEVGCLLPSSPSGPKNCYPEGPPAAPTSAPTAAGGPPGGARDSGGACGDGRLGGPLRLWGQPAGWRPRCVAAKGLSQPGRVDDEVEPAPVGSTDIGGVRGDEPLLPLQPTASRATLTQACSRTWARRARALLRGQAIEAVELSAAAVGTGSMATGAGGQRQREPETPSQGKVHVLRGKGSGGISGDGLQPRSRRGTGLGSQQSLLRGSLNPRNWKASNFFRKDWVRNTVSKLYNNLLFITASYMTSCYCLLTLEAFQDRARRLQVVIAS